MDKIMRRRFLVCALLSALLLFVLTPFQSQAAPVTFRFEAVINTVFDGVPFDSGIDFAVGDTVTGHFTFEPATGDGTEISFSAVQPFGAGLLISGASLKTSPQLANLEIQATNNSPVFDYPPATVIDSLVVGSTLTMENPLLFPNISSDKSSFRLSLRGTSSILSLPSHPGDVDVWNMFNFERQLLVSIRGEAMGVRGFQATVEQFTPIPEPSSVISFFGLMMLSLFAIRNHQMFSPR